MAGNMDSSWHIRRQLGKWDAEHDRQVVMLGLNVVPFARSGQRCTRPQQDASAHPPTLRSARFAFITEVANAVVSRLDGGVLADQHVVDDAAASTSECIFVGGFDAAVDVDLNQFLQLTHLVRRRLLFRFYRRGTAPD